jgi:SAM-dependent methyltransferase
MNEDEKLATIRETVRSVIRNAGHDWDIDSAVVLDVAPQDYLGAKEFFKNATVKTLDIDKNSGCDYIMDICATTLTNHTFDVVICTEVLEHTLDPFSAVKEIHRILKPGGVAYVTTPFNFRIHGPAPDCWRFTETGLKHMFRIFKRVHISEVIGGPQYGMPIQYITIATKE